MRLLALGLCVGCVAEPATPPAERWAERGTSPSPVADCVGNGDDVLTADEVVIAAGVTLRMLAPPTGVEATAPLRGAPPWRIDAPTDAVEVAVTPESVDGLWFADRFPDADAVSTLERGNLGVLRRDEGGIVLLGLVSSEAGGRALVYDPPVPSLPWPLRVGDGWDVTADVSGQEGAQVWPQDLGADGVVSLRHRMTAEVLAHGMAQLPGADLPAWHLRLLARAEVHNSAAGLVATEVRRTDLLVAECVGVVARVVSRVDEADPDFAVAADLLVIGVAEDGP